MRASRKNKTPIQVTRRKTKFLFTLTTYLTQTIIFKTRAEAVRVDCMLVRHSLKKKLLLKTVRILLRIVGNLKAINNLSMFLYNIIAPLIQ